MASVWFAGKWCGEAPVGTNALYVGTCIAVVGIGGKDGLDHSFESRLFDQRAAACVIMVSPVVRQWCAHMVGSCVARFRPVHIFTAAC